MRYLPRGNFLLTHVSNEGCGSWGPIVFVPGGGVLSRQGRFLGAWFSSWGLLLFLITRFGIIWRVGLGLAGRLVGWRGVVPRVVQGQFSDGGGG